VTVDAESMRALRRLLDDVIHAAHVADEPARDWNARACDAVGAESLASLDAGQAVRLVDKLRLERDRLYDAARSPIDPQPDGET
jgi:hypothetical protein